MSKKENFYEEQMVLICKSEMNFSQQLEAFKKLWIERCALPDDYQLEQYDAFNMYLDMCYKYFTFDRFHMEQMIKYASPQKCHEIGYWTEEVNKIWYLKKELHQTVKYDYWLAMFAAIVSYIRMLLVKDIPFPLTKLEDRFNLKK
jgi:hypothetical protein